MANKPTPKEAAKPFEAMVKASVKGNPKPKKKNKLNSVKTKSDGGIVLDNEVGTALIQKHRNDILNAAGI